MAFIGNTVQTQGFSPAIDYFNGNGVTVTFTLSRPVASVAQMIVAVDNVIQNPSSAFTVSGNSITFTSAPLSGTNNIWVEYTSLITTYAGISQDPSVIGDITATGGYLSTGDFGNSYIDGTIVDYVTGNARITTGPLDDMTFYHGGTSGRSEMMKLSYAGNSTLAGGLAATGAGSFQGVYVGKGGSAVSTNTAVGYQALTANTSGDRNVAVGYQSAVANTTGINTSVGYQSLYTNTTGTENTAVGFLALNKNTTGNYNAGLSDQALYNNTTGSNNVGVGFQALAANTTASSNTAVGYQAGYGQTTGGLNAYLGTQAGYTNQTGIECVYSGWQAGYLSTGSYNVFIGGQTGYYSTGSFNTYIGTDCAGAATTGTKNTFIGYGSGSSITTGSLSTILGRFNGNQGGLDIRTASNYIVLSDGDGNPRVWTNNSGVLFVPGIYNNTSVQAANVVSYSGGAGDLYRSTSSARYKTDIVNSTRTLEDLLKLRPVTYKNINPAIDRGQTFGGLIAEEVDAAGLTEFVMYNEEGTPESLAYGNMVSLCISAIKEQQAMIEELKTKVAALEAK